MATSRGLVFACAFVGTALSPSAFAQTSIGNGWVAYFKSIGAAGEALGNDEFADVSFPNPPIGTPATIRFQDGGLRGYREETSAFWTYEDGILRFVFSPGSGGLAYEGRSVVLSSRIIPSGWYTGTNAYGVRSRVDKYRKHTAAVGFKRIPDGMPFYSGTYFLGDRTTGNTYWVQMRASGSEAKRLIGSVIAEIDLERNAQSGENPKCRTLIDTPTISSPVESSDTTCTFFADIARVRFKRTDTGELLASWPSVDPPAALEPAIPSGPDEQWVTARDYPHLSIHSKEEGDTAVEVSVLPSGIMADCKVTQSSGHQALDRAACFTLSRTAKFDPVYGPNNVALNTVYKRVIEWRLPSAQSAKGSN